MPVTYSKIATVTVGSGGATSIEFTSIPSSYTDLEILYSIRGDTSAVAASLTLDFNGSTANFTSRYLEGNGATAGSYTSPAQFGGSANANTSTSSTFSSHRIYIPNYAGSNNKSFCVDYVSENNATTAYAGFSAGLWSQTAAITSVKLDVAGNALQYSTATLYGIKNS